MSTDFLVGAPASGVGEVYFQGKSFRFAVLRVRMTSLWVAKSIFRAVGHGALPHPERMKMVGATCSCEVEDLWSLIGPEGMQSMSLVQVAGEG